MLSTLVRTWPLVLLPICQFLLPALAQSSVEGWPVHNDDLNNVVLWDHYSLSINGERLFIFAGEWHYWRIPVPEMWRDILEKIKASGANAFTFYAHWGFHAPNSTTLDFTTGAHDFTQLFTLAKEIGLYVLVRAGPYVNAEANAGGFPLWLTTGAYGTLRNNDTRYTDAWTPYWSTISQLTAQYQVTRGQNAISYQIENEYGDQWIGNPDDKIPDPAAEQYMEMLEQVARANGIDVPLTANAPNMNTKSWSSDFAPNATGNVDIDGLDSYPSCWTCDLSACTGTNGAYVAYQLIDYFPYFQEVQPTQPSFMPEFQGGSFNPWGGPEGGCPNDIGADFANIFYRGTIASRVTAISLYMLYGGTNWGSLAAPVVATSYDYSSPISEDRSIGSKYYEMKLLSLFTRVARDLTVTDRLGNSTAYTTNANVKATELRNPLTNAAFYVTVHDYSPSGTSEPFQLHVSTSAGNLTIPQLAGNILLNGHQSKIIVTDFTFGTGHLIYSTAEVLTYTVTDGKPILVLWVPTGESAEFYLGSSNTTGAVNVASCQGCASANVASKAAATGIIVNIGSVTGKTVLHINGMMVMVVDRPTAYLTWVPGLTNNVSASEDQTIIVQGPYLVRNASIVGTTVNVNGDIGNATALEVFTPAEVTSVTWNGNEVTSKASGYGSLIANLDGPDTSSVTLPKLNSWKVADSLPERLTTYNDSGPAWVVANHLTTSNPTPPQTLPVLYVDDYGFHNGVNLFRGYFTGAATGVNLTVQGGTAFGYSVFLNNKHIGSYLGSPNLESYNLYLPFTSTNATIHSTKPNLLFIIQDNTGHDETSGALNPRGILQAQLSPASLNFTSWKIAGTAGGDRNLIDPVRGALAEGGLACERLGWTLPGFNDSDWDTAASSGSNIGFTGAGVRFYRTVVPLSIPSGLDVSLSFMLTAPRSQAMRVQLFVNGYQYGRFNPWIGNQVVFPVPPGILDYQGDNVIGVSLWNQLDGPQAAHVEVDWKVEYVVESSFDVGFDGGYLRPGWTSERLVYA